MDDATASVTNPVSDKPQRNAKGQWVKGCKWPYVNKGKISANVGRPKELKTQIKDALSIAEDEMPDILKSMVRRAQDDDHRDSQRAGEYLMDRLYGKARQGLDIDHDIGITLRVVYPQAPAIDHVGIIEIEGRELESEKPLYLVE